MAIVVKSSNSVNNLKTTASHLYMKYSASSLRNLQQWRQNMFIRTRNKSGKSKKTNSWQDERDEKKEKSIDTKKGDIIYNTRDGRVLHAFHSCEEGKIIWNGEVYDNLKTWLTAVKKTPPACCLID